jgi:hypothetical protein
MTKKVSWFDVLPAFVGAGIDQLVYPIRRAATVIIIAAVKGEAQ